MKCPFCGSEQSSVVDKRSVQTSGEIRRRRSCYKCHKRYTTYERVATATFNVIKRDGRKEAFNPEKIKRGLEFALEKRLGSEQIQAIANKVEQKIRAKSLGEVSSKVIGQAVLNELKKADKIGYLRFASVYRNFEDAAEFEKELQNLKL